MTMYRWWRLKNRLPVEEENPTSWLIPIGAVGLILVIVGVIGEGIFEGLSSTAETALRAHNDQILAQTQKEAGDARDSSEKAAQAATSATESARVAGVEAGNAVEDLLRLRKDAGARRLTGAQKEVLRKGLLNFPSHVGVGWNNAFDSEAGDFAGDITSVLSSAHWIPTQVAWLPNGKYGLFLGTADPEITTLPAYKELVSAFSSIGMPLTPLHLISGDGSIMGGPEPHVLYLLVGTHPPVTSAQAIKPKNKTNP